MKKFAGVVGVVCFMLAVSAHAEEANPQAGYAGGFFVQSDDGSFNLKIKGRLQPRLQFTDSDLTERALTFSVRRATLTFIAKIKDKTTFNFALNHGTNTRNFDSVNVAAASLDQEIIPAFNVSVGMVGLPIDLLGDSSSGASLLTEVPVVWTQSDGFGPLTVTREAFGSPDGLGVWLSGDIGKFGYAWSVVNGNESNYNVNPDTKFSTGARLVFNILEPVNLASLTDYDQSEKPAWTVGVGGTYQGRRTDSAFAEARDDALGLAAGTSAAPEIRRMVQAAGGSAFRWKGFSIQAEAYYRFTRFTSLGDLPPELQDSNLTDFGYYGMVGYYVIPKKFEVAAMASQVFREGPDNNANQFGAGVNWYIKGNNLKAQLTYVWSEDYDDIIGTRNNKAHKGVLQLQTQF